MKTEAIRYYRQLADFLSYLIEDGEISRNDLTILANILEAIAGADPGPSYLVREIIDEHGSGDET